MIPLEYAPMLSFDGVKNKDEIMKEIEMIMSYWSSCWPHLLYEALVSRKPSELDFVRAWSVTLARKSAIVWSLLVGVKYHRSSKY